MNHEEQGYKPDNNSRENENQPSNNPQKQDLEHPLASEIRDWIADIPVADRPTIAHCLKFKWAFAEKIQSHVKTLYSENRIPLAQQIKMDFDHVKSAIREFDVHCEKRCYEDDEADILESKRQHIETLGNKLANLIAGRCRLAPDPLYNRKQDRKKAELQRQAPLKIVELPPKQNSGPAKTMPIEWISFAEAAELAGKVNKSTLTRWADEGKIECNGKAGRERKLNKYSVMNYKQKLSEKGKKIDDRDVEQDRGY